jgi:nucleotide-binding universal stress UspA family protein
MYRKILIPLENSASDRTILDHIRPIAKWSGASIVLMHVADGWAARNFDQLKLAESEEMKADRAYLESVAATLRAEGFTAEYVLAMGEPPDEIIKASRVHHADLIAMATHGHGFVGDLIFGQTVDKVRHLVDIPVLLLKAKSV